MAKKKSKQRGGLPPDKYLTDKQLTKLKKYVKDMADVARTRGGLRGLVDELVVELLAASGLRARTVRTSCKRTDVSHFS